MAQSPSSAFLRLLPLDVFFLFDSLAFPVRKDEDIVVVVGVHL